MATVSKNLVALLWVGMSVAPVSAAVLTGISFTSNGGGFINDTIADGFSSPLAFTASTGLNQPFLNAADSSITLNYGNYYAIAFLGFGQHINAGSITFKHDGTSFTQNVTFPDPAVASAVFASFALPNGDSVTVAATGLSADRIRIIAGGDGAGLQAGGAADAFYQFNFVSAVPEPATGVLLAAGLAMVWAARRKFV